MKLIPKLGGADVPSRSPAPASPSTVLAVLSPRAAHRRAAPRPPGARHAAAGNVRVASAASGQKVKLTFWTWVPNMDKVVAIWNKAHPDIQVQVQVQAGGDAELTKLLTAAKAGQPAGRRAGRVPGAARRWSRATTWPTSRSTTAA